MDSARKINFGAGPAKLPEEVLEHVAREMHSFKGIGLSVLEMSHRSPECKEILSKAVDLLRKLMNIPDTHEVLFMHGGGTGQFAAIPLNFKYLSKSSPPQADYVITGAWSKKAAVEAEKYVKVHKVLSPDKFHSIPDSANWSLNPESAFVWYCANETIDGVEFWDTPKVPEGTNLVADISSNILSRPIDVSKKNLGIGGLTITIVRKDLIGHQDPQTPAILSYQEMAKHESLYNTPCVFALYVTELVLEWIDRNGGLAGMEEKAAKKSTMLYEAIDNSGGFYTNPVDKNARSRMNVPFRIRNGDEGLEEDFIKQSKQLGMLALKGHRSVGGIRASIYNAVSVEETEALVKFMNDFKNSH